MEWAGLHTPNSSPSLLSLLLLPLLVPYLQVVECLPHVAICSEDDCLKAIITAGHTLLGDDLMGRHMRGGEEVAWTDTAWANLGGVYVNVCVCVRARLHMC